MKGSKGKKIVIILAAIVVAAIAAVIVFSSLKSSSTANTFVDSGYILVSNPEADEKTVQFKSGAEWKYGTDSTIVFNDIQNNKTTVDEESYVHYTSGTLQALTNGVIVDLDALDDNQFTEHYAVSNKIFLTPSGDGYQMTNSTVEHSVSNLIWKLNESKYMLVSDTISLHFADDDVREVSGFVELSYIDNGVIQFQTEENFWQTVSSDCYGKLANGIIVDFSLKNIEDEDGEVLMDFNKIVVDSEDNVEVQPISESLSELTEEVVPHFNVNAEDGQDGSSGSSGSSGGSGSSGSQGGSQGQGDDGYDGVDRDKAEDGEDGDPGTSQKVDGTVLHFPVFTLAVPTGSTDAAWEIGSTYCKGNIMVSDSKGMLVSRTEDGKTGAVYLVDIEDGSTVASYEMDFSAALATGYPFEFLDLQPDHAYRLVVDAPIQTSVTSQAYVRNFISKAFYTDSTGVYFSVDGVTETTANVSLNTESYSAAEVICYQLYNTYAAAVSANTSVGDWVMIQGVKSHTAQTIALEQFKNKSPDQTFYLRGYVVVKENNNEVKYLTDQILEIQTLKERATVGSPLVSSNRYSWGFDITPGIVNDPNKGIVKYTYEFYHAADVENGKVKTNATTVKTVEVYSTDSFTVPLDGTILQAGYSYVVRCVAEFNDNEKTYNIESGFSNACTVVGSQVPTVYFTNEGGGTTTIYASNSSEYYDAIVGTIHVDQSTTGARLVLTGLTNEDQNTYHPYAIIRASGYYYVKYPVYPADTDPTALPSDGKYLLATDDNGYVSIQIPDTALSGLDATGGVDGLKGGLGYSIIIMGNLTENGTTYTDQGIVVGTCTVSTPKMQGVLVEWGELDSTSSQKLQDASFKFKINNLNPDDEAETTFERMMDTLDTIELKLYNGTPSSSTKEQIGYTVIVTNDPNQIDDNPNDNVKYLSFKAFNENASSLAEAIVDKMSIKDEHFGIESTQLRNNVYIEITLSEDYTINPEKRIHQSDYIAEPDDPEEPVQSYVYQNIYSMEDTICEITIGNTPDPLPEDDVEDHSFVKNENNEDIVWYDTDKDGSASDKAVMQANYPNSCKIATEITYYVFDAPDFYKVYDAGTYQVSSSYAHKTGSTLTPINVLTAVTAVKKVGNEEVGNWLGKVTLSIPSDGSIPVINFIPETPESYIGSLISDPTELAEKLATYYETGTFNGENYLFYNKGSQEPKRGHQFVFAWTIKYVRNQSNPDEVEYYPFDLSEYTTRYSEKPSTYGKNGYYSIPHSKPQDQPMLAPEISAVPWTTDYSTITSSSVTGTITWRAGIQDDDEVVARTNSGKTAALLYTRNSQSSGSLISSATVQLKRGGTVLDRSQVISSSAYLVTIPIDSKSPGSSTTTGIAVQRYTDVYTTKGRSTDPSATPFEYRLFESGSSYITGSSYFDAQDTLYTFSTTTGAKDKYYVAFTYYIEPHTNLNTKVVTDPQTQEDVVWVNSPSTLKVAISATMCKEDPEHPGTYLKQNLSKYRVTVTGNADDVKLVDGIRLRFSAPNGKSVVLDKYLDVDQDNYQTITIEGSTATLAFDIFISRDLGNKLYDVTDQDGVTVTASALYESDKTGFGYVVDNDSIKNYTFAYNRYSLYGLTNGNISVGGKGTWRFDNTKKLSYSLNGTVPYKMGSFFNFSSVLYPVYDDTEIVDYAVDMSSTRAWEWSEYNTVTSLGLDGDFGQSGVVSVPRVLTEARVTLDYTEYTTDHPQGKTQTDEPQLSLNIPSAVKDIDFNTVEKHVNSLKIPYTTSSGDTVIYYTVQKLDGDEIVEENFFWQAHNTTTHKWEKVVGAETLITANYSGNTSTDAFNAAMSALTTTSGAKLITTVTSSTGSGKFSVDDLEASTKEEKRTYRIKAWYWTYDETSKTGCFVQYNDLSAEPNRVQAETLNVPAVTLTKNFIDSSYTQKSLRLTVTPEKATNFYYTIELYRHNSVTNNDDLVTYLYAGKTTNQQIIDVGSALTNATSNFAYVTTTANITHNGDDIVFDTTGCERLYLDYDATEENNNYYVLRVRMYDLGSGPAWNEDPINTDLLKDNEPQTGDTPEELQRKAALRECYIKTVETPYTNSQYDVSGEIEMVTDENDTSYSEAVFTPSYANKSNTFRSGKYTFVVIRTTTDSDNNTVYQNVTRFVEIATTTGNKSYSQFGGILNLSSKQKLYLALDSTNFPTTGTYPLKSGDVFTLYPYVVEDELYAAVGTGNRAKKTSDYTDGLTGTALVDYILAGRTTYANNISTSDILTAAEVAALADQTPIERYTVVDNNNLLSGYSKMPISNPYSLTYGGETVNAGTLSVNLMYDEAGQVNVLLQNPVGFTNIKQAVVSITAKYSYTDESEETLEDTVQWSEIDTDFQYNAQGTAGNYTYIVTPEFEVDKTLPDFTWVSYTITLKFKAEDSQNPGTYYYVTMKKQPGDNNAQVSQDGQTYSKYMPYE